MHPAYSVIFFTSFSGLGYGLLILLGIIGPAGLIQPARGFGLAAFGLAFTTVTAGLLASTFHLGHPERAWRAFSQWRTSWLSREGVVAVATYVPTGLFALGWVLWGQNGGLWGIAGMVGALCAALTVAATGMIYASLPTIAAWNNRWVVPAYLALSLATGSLWLAALSRAFGIDGPAVTHLPVALLILAWIVKVAYWAHMDGAPATSTAQTATGLGATGPGEDDQPVRLLASPHTQENFVMREMGFRIARKHALKLRRTAQGLGFFLPLVATQLLMFLSQAPSIVAILIAFAGAVSCTAGVLIERWLFFAEARHVVMLYYGGDER
ncbi:MAG: dimethyl sulfoxide reductase anchor subunit [Alphaproteobacteria bacterium]|nr:dimethyl sulfoxide reductase anchor subunit [Alphaproteobacteria bacterium]